MQHYRFGPWVFKSDLGTLETENHTESLDPKIAELLHLFLQHPGKLFSRDELLDIIWKGTIVNDNSVSWAISQLRKALKDEAKSPQYLETLPKKGYRFIAKVSLVESGAQLHPISAHPQKAHQQQTSKLMAVGLVLMMLLVVAWLALDPKESAPAEIVDARLITAMDGVEKSAEISPDGLILAFAHKGTGANHFAIWLKPLKENRQFSETQMDGTVLPDKVDSSRDVPAWQLTQNGFSYEQLDWGEDAYNLFALRTRKNDVDQRHSCHLVQLKLDLSRKSIIQEREITQCYAGGATRISFNPRENKLYFSDKRNDDATMALYEYDIRSDVLSRLLEADESGGGIRFIDYSAANNKILILQDINWRSTRFAALSLQDNSVNTLFTQQAIYYSAYWGLNPDTIWLNWGNESVLEYNINSDTSEFILKSSFGWNFNLKPAGHEQVTFEVSDANGADFSFFSEKRLKDKGWQKTTTSYTESSAAWSPKTGKLAYVSNQNGLPQVWLKDSRYETARQFTNANEFREIQYLSWSQDESKIIGTSEHFVGLLDLSKQRYMALLNNGIAPYWPKLSPDNQHVLVTHLLEGQWRLYLYPVQGTPVTTNEITNWLVTDGYIAEFLSAQEIIFSRHDADGLFKLNLETKEITTLWPALPAGSFWQMHDQHLYFRDGQSLKSITLTTVNEPQLLSAITRTVTNIPAGLGSTFDINPVTGEILFIDYRRSQSDIKIARYRRTHSQ